ncbi:MAG TPA: tripartite tricarboxylate transporter substrate binding protein [Xanthobacteraceae bacterium]|nr:tripartite tricarboxylate transporter substrate binding protein [Xanthobacteraceae bacterium]
MRHNKLMFVVAALAAVLAGVPSAARAAAWPERPIHLIVPFPAGSSSDIVARVVAHALGEKLGQTVVVENRPGASGEIAAEYVAHATPDGYTLGLINTSFTLLPSLSTTHKFDAIKSFAPISMLGASPFVLASYPGVPAHTVQDVIKLAKSAPGKHTFAEAGPATLANLAGVLFNKMAGVQITAVSYRGTEQEVPDLIAGRVDMAYVTIPPTLALIQQNKVRAIAVTGARRSPALPDVPTVAEAGLSGYEAVLWQALNAPAGTPAPILARLNTETNALLRETKTTAALAKVGVDADPSTPQQLADRIAADIKKWHDVIVSAGIKVQ